MRTYIIKRFLLMIPTLFGVSLVVWLVLTSAPAPPITSRGPGSSEEGQGTGEAGGVSQAVKVFRAQYGLDKPAVLNTLYRLEPEDVREAVETLSRGLDAPLKDRNHAQERLIEWGYYAVRPLAELIPTLEGPLRDQALGWLVRSAQRVAVGLETGRLDPETTQQNAEIAAENQILGLFLSASSAPDSRREAGVAAALRWYHGHREHFPATHDRASVERALEAGPSEGWSPGSVAALVEIALDHQTTGTQRARALKALPAAVRRDGSDEIENALSEIEAHSLELMVWSSEAAEPRRLAGEALLRNWWEGTSVRWDYDEGRWLGVLLFETRFARYWGNLLTLDLGYSTVHKIPVLELVFERLKYSLTLALSSLVLAYLIAIPLGIFGAAVHQSWIDRVSTLGLFALYSLPSFFVATLVVRYMAIGQPESLELIPDGGFWDTNAWRMPTLGWIQNVLWHIAAPVLCMTYVSLAALSRYAKTGLLNVLRQDYVRTARAKGLSETVVVAKHATRNGIIPVVTLLGTTLPVVVGGSFIIEWIFSIPGFGLLTVQSIFNRDYNVVIGVQLIVAVLTMVGILISDLLYAIVDPRISFS